MPTVTFYTVPSDKGSITFNGATYFNGQSHVYPEGVYNALANVPSGYEFLKWTATGGVVCELESENPTPVTVEDNGTLTAEFRWLPPQYTEAVANLKAFRSKVLHDLVGSRVVAGLDANHDSMLKYKGVVEDLSVVPYVFARVRENALALRFKGLDVGVGESDRVVAEYKGELAEYPLKPPYKVPLRNLPQVDIFSYQPPSDVHLAEKASEEVWGGFFTLQSDRGTLKENPDVQNVFYDYYKLRAVGRARVELTLSLQELGFNTYKKLKGEATIMVRSVTPQEDSVIADYDFYCFLDADFFGDTAKIESVPMVFVVTSSTASNPLKVIMAGGKRLETNIVGVYEGLVTNGQLVGWSKVAGGFTEDVKEVLWAAMSTLTIRVNDVTKGTTDPVPNIYDYKATETVLVTAIPEEGYVVVRWELDGVQYPPADTFSAKMYRDHDLLCVFGTADTAYLRPNGDVESLWIRRYPADTTLYTQIDEVESDGDATYIYDHIVGKHSIPYYVKALFTVPSDVVPEDKIIEYVEVFARAKLVNSFYPPKIAFWIKTHGVDYVTDYVWVGFPYTVYSYRWTVNPYTGEAWTKEEVDELKIGYQGQITTATYLETWDYLRVTQKWAEVPFYEA